MSSVFFEGTNKLNSVTRSLVDLVIDIGLVDVIIVGNFGFKLNFKHNITFSAGGRYILQEEFL